MAIKTKFFPIDVGPRKTLELPKATTVAKLQRHLHIANKLARGVSDRDYVPKDYALPEGLRLPTRLFKFTIWAIDAAGADGFVKDMSAPKVAAALGLGRFGAPPPKHRKDGRSGGINGERSVRELIAEAEAWGILVKGKAQKWKGEGKREAWNTAQLLAPETWRAPSPKPGQGRRKTAKHSGAGRRDLPAPGAGPLLKIEDLRSSPLPPHVRGETSACASRASPPPTPPVEGSSTPALPAAVAPTFRLTTTPSPASQAGNATPATPPATTSPRDPTAPPAQRTRVMEGKEHEAGHDHALDRQLVAIFLAKMLPPGAVASRELWKAVRKTLHELGGDERAKFETIVDAIDGAILRAKIKQEAINFPTKAVFKNTEHVRVLARLAVSDRAARRQSQETQSRPSSATAAPVGRVSDTHCKESLAALFAGLESGAAPPRRRL